MPTELLCLALMGLLSLVAFLPASFGKFRTWGRGWAGSNRDSVPDRDLPLWVGRCERAHNNLKDNLPGFAIAVILILMAGRYSSVTSTACMIYVSGRVLHFVSYGLGLRWGRILGFAAGLFSNIYLFIVLFR
jgi:uncharacterized MAPEG superfamily protein